MDDNKMGGSSHPTAAVAVVGPQFCVGHPVELIMTRKMMTLKDGTFGVTDVDEKLVFQIRGKFLSLHDRRVLLDAAANPLLTFQMKVSSPFLSLSVSVSLSLSK